MQRSVASEITGFILVYFSSSGFFYLPIPNLIIFPRRTKLEKVNQVRYEKVQTADVYHLKKSLSSSYNSDETFEFLPSYPVANYFSKEDGIRKGYLYN